MAEQDSVEGGRTSTVLLALGAHAGVPADPRLLRTLEQRIEEYEQVDDVVDLLTTVTGVRRILVCVRADFVDTVTAGEVERTCPRIDRELAEEQDP